MDLTVKSREENIYYLQGTERRIAMDKEKWTSLVEKHIKNHNHYAILEKIKGTVKLWNDKDNIHDIALIVYASKYCKSVQELKVEKNKKEATFNFNVVKDDMGSDQLKLY